METLIKTLVSENGVLGLVAAICFALYFWERKTNKELVKENLEKQIADTKAKVAIASALESLSVTMGALESHLKSKIEDLLDVIKKSEEEERLRRAREEGRREVTNPRIRVPLSGEYDDEP